MEIIGLTMEKEVKESSGTSLIQSSNINKNQDLSAHLVFLLQTGHRRKEQCMESMEKVLKFTSVTLTY